MPYAAKPFDPNEQNQQNNQGAQGGVNISGGSGANFATNVPGQNASGGGKQKSSGQYANIQSYLDANREQADQMGQKITDQVTKQADDATEKVNTYNQNAPKVEAYDPNEAINNAQNLSADQKNQYQQQKANGGYTGPQQLDQVAGYQDAQKSATTAATNVANAGTETGQQQLLKSAYERPKYSAGENRLDQVLLQNSAGSKSNLENLSQKYSGLGQMFNDAQTNVGNAINNANTQALANQQNVVNAEAAARKAMIDPIQARADEYNKNKDSRINSIVEDAGDETLSADTLAALGLNEGQKLFGLNLQSYINQNATQAGLNNVATADERAKYAALANLFGDPTMTEITANGEGLNPASFNKQQFDKDLAGRQAEYDDFYKNYSGGLLDWATQNGKIGDWNSNLYRNNYGMAAELDKLNSLTPEQLAKGSVSKGDFSNAIGQRMQGDNFINWANSIIPDYYNYLINSQNANRVVKKG